MSYDGEYREPEWERLYKGSAADVDMLRKQAEVLKGDLAASQAREEELRTALERKVEEWRSADPMLQPSYLRHADELESLLAPSLAEPETPRQDFDEDGSLAREAEADASYAEHERRAGRAAATQEKTPKEGRE